LTVLKIMKRINFVNMDIRAEKLDLIQWMAQLSDETIVRKIKALRNETAQSTELSSAHKAFLDERIASHEANPESGSSWEEVKQRITSR
jgi:putative addiction module component (TIGR02574 family)